MALSLRIFHSLARKTNTNTRQVVPRGHRAPKTSQRTPKRLFSTQNHSGSHDTVSGNPLPDEFSNHDQSHRSKQWRKKLGYPTFLAGILASGIVAYSVYQADEYSQNDLNVYTPESLDIGPVDVLHTRARLVAHTCVEISCSTDLIMSSPSYGALRKGVYSEDKYIRLLSLRALAALAHHSKDIRRRIAQTMDFTRLASEIFVDQPTIENIESDPIRSRTLRYKYRAPLDENYEDLVSDDLDALLVYAFNDIASVAAKSVECHPKLLDLGYAKHVANLLKSPDMKTRIMAVGAVSGLTKTVEGRQALARTDAFPSLYKMIYETPELIFSTENIHEAKFALQQLLLSESALDIMLPVYEKFFLKMTKEAKEDMLLNFDIIEEGRIEYAKQFIKTGGTAFMSGLVWGGLRGAIRFTGKSIKIGSTPKILRGMANSATGALILAGAWVIFNSTEERIFARDSDGLIGYLGTVGAFGILSTVGLAATITAFPHCVVPALIGANVDRILKNFHGTHPMLVGEAKRNEQELDKSVTESL